MDFALAGGQASLSAVLSENALTRAEAAAQGVDAAAAQTGSDVALRQVAKAFEQVFLAEMLKHADFGENNGPFSGGHGEEAFRSFLVDEYASALSESANFGLADKIYAQLKEKVANHE